jgi:hypothetical protein
MRTITIKVDIHIHTDAVMAYACNPLHLPQWAAGFARSIKRENEEWVVQTAEGLVRLWFTPPNADGILDHIVRMPNGEEIINTMRVVPKGSGSEVSFLLHQRRGMDDKQLAEDAALVQADLQRLKALLED